MGAPDSGGSLMELADIVGLRPVPCAGLLVSLTRRCPLRCAHCSTASTMTGEQTAARTLVRFAGTFTPADRPEVVMMTGGEPLLRPALMEELAHTVRAAGTRSAVLSGMFFARNGRVPARILRAITAVDHFSASLDVHHEREIPRGDVLKAMRKVLDAGVAASFHIVGSGPADPYLADVVGEVRRVFGDRVPMLVSQVRAVGRAAAWLSGRVAADDTRPLPCAMAAWPVVAFDGTVTACCNQEVVDGRPVPGHLLLGHIAEDDWDSVRGRALASPMLRLIRSVGPVHLRLRHGGTPAPGGPTGYCATCRALGDHPEVIERAGNAASGPVGRLLDQEASRIQVAAGPVGLVRRYGCARYADLVDLPRHGRSSPAGQSVVPSRATAQASGQTPARDGRSR